MLTTRQWEPTANPPPRVAAGGSVPSGRRHLSLSPPAGERESSSGVQPATSRDSNQVIRAATQRFRATLRRALTLLAIMSLLPFPQVAFAQEAQPTILRDAETEALFADMSRDIIRAAGLSPANVKVVLINDDSINAFTAGGQTVYIHSGLIEAAENVNQLQGVVAHEIGHIADGHVVLAERAMRPALGITLLSMVIGIAAMAAGAGDAGAGIMAAGQQAAMGHYLSFSRNQEATADASAATYLQGRAHQRSRVPELLPRPAERGIFGRDPEHRPLRPDASAQQRPYRHPDADAASIALLGRPRPTRRCRSVFCGSRPS